MDLQELKDLTSSKYVVLRYIYHNKQKDGDKYICSKSRKYIAKEIEVSLSAINRSMSALIAQEYIKTDGTHNYCELTPKALAVFKNIM